MISVYIDIYKLYSVKVYRKRIWQRKIYFWLNVSYRHNQNFFLDHSVHTWVDILTWVDVLTWVWQVFWYSVIIQSTVQFTGIGRGHFNPDLNLCKIETWNLGSMFIRKQMHNFSLNLGILGHKKVIKQQ